MSDQDPWVRRAMDPSVHVVSTPQPTSPPPGLHGPAPRRTFFSLPRTVIGGVVAVAAVVAFAFGVLRVVQVFDTGRDVDGDGDSRIVGDLVDGDGYRYLLPTGWTDAHGMLPDSREAAVVDTFAVQRGPDGQPTSFISVEVAATHGRSIEEMRSTWRRNAERDLPTGVTLLDGPDTAIAGSEAVAVVADDISNEQGVVVDFQSLLTIRDDHVYALTFYYPSADAVAAQGVMAEALSTWEWD